MRLGVQQPYFFPYPGYYQLLFAVDRFVAYDDVNWIKGGWINRNRMLIDGRVAWFTIPTRNASPNVAIDQVMVGAAPWRRKMRDRFAQAYARAPFRDDTLALIDRVLATPSERVVDFAVASLEAVRDHLSYATPISRSRDRYPHVGASAQERLIGICREEGATRYLNAIGGRELYDAQAFRHHGVELQFLRGTLPVYPQGVPEFIGGLSMVDLLMHVPADRVRAMLAAFELVDSGVGGRAG